MHKELIKQLMYFQKVSVPRYIEVKIQRAALSHLKLTDMGKLKDRMDGQAYYDKLKVDILAEYAFETVYGIQKFNWNKREQKIYVRKQYRFNEKTLKLITFIGNDLPQINKLPINNYIFIYVNPDNRVYISGLATKTKILEQIAKQNINTSENIDFSVLIYNKTIDELLEHLE